MLRRWKEKLMNEGRPLQERVFLLTNAAAAFSLGAVVLLCALVNPSVREILAVLILLVMGLITVRAARKRKLRSASIALSALLVFALVPLVFFTRGGMTGGAPIWFIFTALFVSMLLSGKEKYFFLVSELMVAAVCYALAYTRPSLLPQGASAAAGLDSYAALVLVSIAVYTMVGFVIRLYQWESRRMEQQKKELEALSNAQSRFFSSMSHEIRTPINTIIGLNEMILREDISDEVAEDAANIQAASKLLLHLINDILDMGKLESGSMQLMPTVYRPGDMLSELVSMFWVRAREKGLAFHVNVAPDVPAELFGDELRIKQILINLLNNAVKYTREGSVTLSIQCGSRSGKDLNIVYTVADTGIGIKKESIPYLFDAFKRVDEEKNRHIEGTGLGLSIVKQLLDLMGGSITVNSVYTQGSTFVIELPQKAAGEETVGMLDLEARHKASREAYRSRFEAPEAKVLVVDDNASNLLVVSKLLRGTRVQVDTAASGGEALRMTLEKAYHVIFMDHLMPEMDGVECHRRILVQTGGKCRDSRVVALTANADADSRALYQREGFDGFLTKPVDADALEKELQRQLPKELVRVCAAEDADVLEESMSWIHSSVRKKLVAITTESTADIPAELLERYEITELPHRVHTERGVFRDGVDIDVVGLLAYMADAGHTVRSVAPDEAVHEAFFSRQLAGANNVIYITLSPKIANSAYAPAAAAAAAFNNVTVIDSGHLSSGQGLQVLEACRMAEAGCTPARIAARLEETRKLVRTSFIVDSLDYLARAGQVSTRIARVTKSLTARPVLVIRGGKMRVGKIFFGSRRRAWKRYIVTALERPEEIDRSMLFITYAGLTQQELKWIREQVETRVQFERVYTQKASPSVTANCGPGTFGLLFRMKEKER